MPLFSDYIPKDNIASEKVSATLAKQPSIDTSPLDHVRASITAQSALKSLDFSSLSNLTDSLQAQQGERFFGSLSRMSEQARRALPTDIPVISQVARGALGAIRDTTGSLERAAQGMESAQGPLGYLGALAGGTTEAVLNAPYSLFSNVTRETLGEQQAQKPLFSLPVVGDVSAENIAGTAGSLVAPMSALERAGVGLAERGLGAIGRGAAKVASKEALGATAGGIAGIASTPTDEQGNLPVGEALLRGAGGAALGALAPTVARQAIQRASDPNLYLMYPTGTGNSIEQAVQGMGKKAEGATLEELDKVFSSAKSTVLSFFDRYSNIDQFEKWTTKKLQELVGPLAPQVDLYAKARMYAGRGVQATQFLKENMEPIVKDLNPKQTDWLDGYLAMRDANEKAMILAKDAQVGHIDTELPNIIRNSPAIRAAIANDPLVADAFSSGQKFLNFAANNPNIINLDPALQTLSRNADAAGQYILDNRVFGTIEVGGQKVELRAVDPAKVESDLNTAAGNDAQLIRNKANQVYDVIDKLRIQMLNSGLINKETYDLFKNKYSNYIPIDIIDYVQHFSERGGTGSQNLTVPQIIKEITDLGSQYNKDRPLNAIMGMAYRVNSAAGRNGIGESLLALRQAIPEVEAIMREVTPGSSGAGPRDVQFNMYDNGQKRTFLLDKNYRSLIEFDQDTLSNWMRVARVMTGAPALTAGATRYNPAFVVLNAIRDARLFTLRNAAEGKPLWDTWKELFKAYGSTFRDILPKSLGGATTADLADLRALGVAGENIFSSTTTNNQVRRLLRGDSPLSVSYEKLKSADDFVGKVLAATEVVGNAVKIPFYPLSLVAKVGEAIEQAPRLAQYRLETAAGKSAQEAGLAAREITMDFDRAGNLAKTVNMFVPFFNVGVQGTERFVRRDVMNALRNPRTAVPAFLGYVMAPALAAEAYNRSAFPNEYADVPDYLKESGQVIVLGRTEPKADGSPGEPRYLYIPIPQELKFLQTVTVNAIDHLLKNYPDSEVFTSLGMKNPDKGRPRDWGDIAKSILGQFSPVNVENPAYLASPLGKTAIELATNRDTFRNLSIVPDPLHALPPEDQVRPWNSALSRALGKQFNISPAKIEYAINSMLGGTGGAVLKTADVAGRAMGFKGSEQPENAPPTSRIENAWMYGRDTILGGIYREKGQQVDQFARDEARKAIPVLVANALANLRADPAYQRYTPSQKLEEERKLSLGVERIVLEAQDPGVFEGTKVTGRVFKYLTSKSARDDLLSDDALQTYNAWLKDPRRNPAPTNEEYRRALMAIPDPRYSMEQKQMQAVREKAIGNLPRTVENFSRR